MLIALRFAVSFLLVGSWTTCAQQATITEFPLPSGDRPHLHNAWPRRGALASRWEPQWEGNDKIQAHYCVQ